MKKIFYNIIDRINAIWYILTKRNFIVCGYNYMTDKSKGAFFIEHINDDEHVKTIFKDATCEYIKNGV